ncbi:MAG: hypothetical protein HN730_06480 [Bdellovibrionales bacterium]|jgi:hypothetical protein|nr:hypothetical protein [Bdellovibrionales bacterium]
MTRYRREDYISKGRLSAIGAIANLSESSKLGSGRNNNNELALDKAKTIALMVNAAMIEEEDSQKAKNILQEVIDSWEKGDDRNLIRKKFIQGMRLFAKSNAGKIWSRFFGNVYPKNTVVSWEAEGEKESLVPSQIMDGETPYGGFFNNPRVLEIAKKDPELGAYLVYRALELLRGYSNYNDIGLMNAHMEAVTISLSNFLERAGQNFSDERLSLISKEILLIVNQYIEISKKIMTGDGPDILDGLEIPDADELKLRVSIIGFLRQVKCRFLDRNKILRKNSQPEIIRKIPIFPEDATPDEIRAILREYGIFAPTVLQKVLDEMPTNNHF